jgi:hypothetical protein
VKVKAVYVLETPNALRNGFEWYRTRNTSKSKIGRGLRRERGQPSDLKKALGF